MKNELALFTLMLALPAIASETTPADAASEPPGDAATLAFAEAMDTCAEASFQAPHPFARGFVIEHRIHGTTDAKCVYSQTMPGDMRMECTLSAEGQTALAKEFREQAAGNMSGSTARQPVWTSDCAIIGKDGKRTPMGG